MSCGCQGGACCDGQGHNSAQPQESPWSLAQVFSELSSLTGLGSIAPADAVTQIIGSDKNVNASSRSAILASAGAGQMLDANGAPAYIPGTAECASATGQSGSNNLKLIQTGSSLALTGLQVGLTTAGVITGAALAPFTAGISALIGLFPLIFGHHAAAVKKEQSVLCAAVPAANNYLQIIAQAVQGGQAAPQTAMAALDSLVSDFQSQVSSIRNDCNAACVMTYELQAIVAVMKSQYQDLINAQNANQVVAPVRPNVVSNAGAPTLPGTSPVASPSAYSSFYSPTSTPLAPNTVANPSPTVAAPAAGTLPSWLPIAAVAAAAFFLMREL
jgi:hypothetical protein